MDFAAKRHLPRLGVKAEGLRARGELCILPPTRRPGAPALQGWLPARPLVIPPAKAGEEQLSLRPCLQRPAPPPEPPGTEKGRPGCPEPGQGPLQAPEFGEWAVGRGAEGRVEASLLQSGSGSPAKKNEKPASSPLPHLACSREPLPSLPRSLPQLVFLFSGVYFLTVPKPRGPTVGVFQNPVLSL